MRKLEQTRQHRRIKAARLKALEQLTPELEAIERGQRTAALRAILDAVDLVQPRLGAEMGAGVDYVDASDDQILERADDASLGKSLTTPAPSYDLSAPVTLMEAGQKVTRIRVFDAAAKPEAQATGGTEADRAIRRLHVQLTQLMLLAGPSDEDALDRLIAGLHADAPHLRAVTRAIHTMARANHYAGHPWLKWSPLLIVGEPGSGKTWLARELAERCNLPHLQLDGASMTSPAPLTGLDGSWKTGRTSQVVQTIADSTTANPVVILDEADKIQGFGGHGSAAPDTILLSVLEPSAARRYADSFLRQWVDLSHVNWILTANDLQAVSQPLRDRCTIVRVPALTLADFDLLVARQIERRALDPDLIDPLRRGFRQGQIRSLRKLMRILDAAEAALSRPFLN